MDTERANVSLKITRSTLERLDAEASRRVVSRHLIMERALLDWLDRADGGDPTAP